ncbi:MAG: indole-3-glycerol phosphate synthase TrpC [Bacteroidetes bacterium]|nr:indole-3-glycerol phosphate synthase TrpC [Bacteroidota bacterium]
MSILHNIIEKKRDEVNERKALYPVALLERSLYFSTPCVSLTHYLRRSGSSGVIAEFKRRSPSRGWINQYADAATVSVGYMQSGAAALSVLTDESFFGGSSKDLEVVRSFNYCPVLRKDFIIDPYQVIEARSIGADAILLIAAALDRVQVSELAAAAAQLGMETLLEIHSADELDRIVDGISVVGVNNRSLKDFSVDIKRSLDLFPELPASLPKISESGLSEPWQVNHLREAGFDGFLIGEQFMKSPDPVRAAASFITQLSHKQQLENVLN